MKKTALLLVVALLMVPVATFAEDGAAIFKAKCAMCHGADGAKNAKANLSGAEVQGKSDADLVKFLTTDAKHSGKVGGEENAKAIVTFLRTLKK